MGIELEDFSMRQYSSDNSSSNGEESERAKLEAFENGYKLGWEDAASMALSERKKLGESISLKLSEIDDHIDKVAHEKYVECLKVLAEILGCLFPAVLAQNLRGVLTDIRGSRSKSMCDPPTLSLPLTARETILEGTDLEAMPNLRLQWNSNLDFGDAYFEWGSGENIIDVNSAIASLRLILSKNLNFGEAVENARSQN